MRHKLLQVDLAAALGISASLVSRLKTRGMPTDSVAAAVAWRRHNLDPAATWEQAARKASAPRARPTQEAVPGRDGAVETIGFLATLAAGDFAKYGERLRLAMAALPESQWDDVALPVELWEKLGALYFTEIDADHRNAGEPSAPLDADEAALLGDFVYRIAAGLYRIEPEPRQ